jgi:tRNA(adenine34) deaminase
VTPSPQEAYMRLALAQARLAEERGEAPVGAVIVDAAANEVLAAGHNETRSSLDPTAHAEIVVLRRAAKRRGSHLAEGCDLYVTLEPCPMCAQALSFGRIRRLYFGAYDPKGGGTVHGARIFERPSCFHRPEVYGGMREEECGAALKRFFAQRRG